MKKDVAFVFMAIITIFDCSVIAKNYDKLDVNNRKSVNLYSNIIINREAVLSYIKNLNMKGAHSRILSGQWVSGPAWPSAYSLFVEELHNKTGKWVSIIGSDYIKREATRQSREVPPRSSLEQTEILNKRLIKHWIRGGLISLTMQLDNPWYRIGLGASCNEYPQPCVPGNILDLLKDDNESGRYFIKQLDIFSENIAPLNKAGIPVLFRPFHEMNGSWFWWGVKKDNPNYKREFIELWRFVYHYLKNEKGLMNLIWVYGPNNAENDKIYFDNENGVLEPASYLYPGSEVVDVVAISFYLDSFSKRYENSQSNKRLHSIPEYEKLTSYGKPFGISEFGPISRSKKNFCFGDMVNSLMEIYPLSSFFFAWQDHPENNVYLSLLSNCNPVESLGNEHVINLDSVDSPAMLRLPRN